METMSASIQQTASESSLSTYNTSLFSPDPHLSRQASSSKQELRASLSLIDTTRVRLAKDFRSLVRSNSSRSSKNERRLFHSAQSREQDARLFAIPGFPPRSTVEPELAVLDMSRDEGRIGRGFGARIVGFLNRSRSRSKKRRSQSLEDAPVSEMPVAFQGGSLGRRNPFIGLGTETSASTSTSTSTTSSAASGSKPTTRLPSRPLSGATTATDTTAKPRRAKTPQPTRPQAITSEHHVHLQTEVLGAASSSSTKKAKKTNIFSVAIANPKPRSTGLVNGTSSSTPDDQRSRGLFSGFRSGSRSGSQSSVGSSRSNVIERTSPRNTPPPPVPKLNADTSKRTRISLSTPLSPTVPVHVLNSPPPPYRQNDYARGRDDVEPDDLDLGGRCSPLCGLQSAMAPTAGPSEKGKERERARGARDRSRETHDERERRRRQEKDITHPRRVGSPILREREREARAALVAPAPLEKVASGSGSGTSRRSSTKESVTNAIKTKRTKHGSFDFERPVSALGGGNIRTVLGMGLGADSYDRARTQPMERSVSVKEKVPRAQELGVTQGHKMTSSLPSSVGRTRRPVLDVDTAPAITRHATESSQATSAPASSATRSHHHHADMDPISPTSSHSGHSSSLGRHTGGRLLRGMHGAFRFEPAVPPIPGSPATDERTHLSGRAAGTSASPTKLRQGRVASKGRSLDLGLSLSWAPQKVKQEAVLSYGRQTSNTTGSTGRSRARWGGAMVDDQGRLGAGSSQASSDVAQAFREALGDAAYGTFKNYVHRFDAHAIPLEGPYGLISHASRLLDNASSLDERSKRALLDRFLRFVRDNQ